MEGKLFPLCPMAVPAAPFLGLAGWWILCWMFIRLAGVFPDLLLCAVCLCSARQTYQIHRGAGLGFLLQALVPFLEAAAAFIAPLGLNWIPRSPDGAWICTVVGLSLLAFAFHWMNGDHSTANILLGGVLLLAAGSDYLTEEGKALVAHSVVAVASITILIISIFTGNTYGMVGSLLAGTAGLLASAQQPPQLLMLRKRSILLGLMAAANLTWRWALQVQHRELELGFEGLLA